MKFSDKFKNKSFLRVLMISAFFLVAWLASLIVGIVIENWSYLITTSITSIFCILGMFVYILVNRKVKEIGSRVKFVFIFMGINFLYMIPFLIIWATNFSLNGHGSIIDSSVFNLWMWLGLTIGHILLMMFCNFYLNYTTDKKTN